MGHLVENSVMIPQGQRRDSNFHISYITLNAVFQGILILRYVLKYSKTKSGTTVGWTGTH